MCTDDGLMTHRGAGDHQRLTLFRLANVKETEVGGETVRKRECAVDGVAGDERGDPSAAGSDRNDPPFGIGGLDRCRSGDKTLVIGHQRRLLKTVHTVGVGGRRDRTPVLQEVGKRVLLTLERVGIAGPDLGIVSVGIHQLAALRGTLPADAGRV